MFAQIVELADKFGDAAPVVTALARTLFAVAFGLVLVAIAAVHSGVDKDSKAYRALQTTALGMLTIALLFSTIAAAVKQNEKREVTIEVIEEVTGIDVVHYHGGSTWLQYINGEALCVAQVNLQRSGEAVTSAILTFDKTSGCTPR